jgi:hydrogenase maturation protease
MTASTSHTAGSRAVLAPEPDRALVVGLGSPDRGDDGVGPAVARLVAARRLPGVDVLVHEDPTDLVALWSGRSVAVVVDALVSGAAPGTVSVLRTGARGQRLPSHAWVATARGGTHAFGLATAVELSRALGRLPDELVVVGVEASALEHRAPLSPRVAAAVPAAAAAVVEVLAGRVHEGVGDVPR